MMHYYDIFDGKNVVLLNNTNTACFAECTSRLSFFEKSNYMLIYHPNDYIHPDLSKDIIKKWVKYLTIIGLPISITDGKIFRKSTNAYSEALDMNGLIYRLDFSKYKSHTHLKIALHLFRHCYERGLQVPLLKAFELKKKYPRESLLELLQFSYLQQVYVGGHTLYGNHDFPLIQSVSSLRNYIENSKEVNYDGNGVSSFFKRANIFTHPKYPINLGPRNNVVLDKTLQEYKNLVKSWQSRPQM